MSVKSVCRQNNVVTLTAQGAGTIHYMQRNDFARGLKLVVDTTAITGTTPTLTVTIRGYDPLSGKYWTLLAGTAVTATGTAVLTVYPGATASAGVTANDILPPQYSIQVVIGGTTPAVTATISALLLA